MDTAAPGCSDTKRRHLERLRRVEGRVRGLARMVEEDAAYCIDVPAQVSAATEALESVPLSLLNEHLTHCAKRATWPSKKPRRPHRMAHSLLKQQSFRQRK